MRSVVGGLLLLAVWPVLACQHGVDASRSMLVARHSGWERTVSTLQQQHAALEHRFGGLTHQGDAPAFEAQTRATLDGARQSLADLDVQIGQVDGRFDRGVAAGERPDQVADREVGRVEGYLQAVSAQLVETGRQLDAVERIETRSASR
jgi:hypothetical protein